MSMLAIGIPKSNFSKAFPHINSLNIPNPVTLNDALILIQPEETIELLKVYNLNNLYLFKKNFIHKSLKYIYKTKTQRLVLSKAKNITDITSSYDLLYSYTKSNADYTPRYSKEFINEATRIINLKKSTLVEVVSATLTLVSYQLLSNTDLFISPYDALHLAVKPIKEYNFISKVPFIGKKYIDLRDGKTISLIEFSLRLNKDLLFEKNHLKRYYRR